jgi:hypothetical protein
LSHSAVCVTVSFYAGRDQEYMFKNKF